MDVDSKHQLKYHVSDNSKDADRIAAMISSASCGTRKVVRLLDHFIVHTSIG